MKRMKKMWKKAAAVLLAVLAFIAVYPICFLLTGSLMGGGEIRESLGPALEAAGGNGNGCIQMPLLPRYPTLRSYVELLLDSPEFFVMFWNSVRLTAGILAGQVLFGVPAAWGFAKGRFPFRKALFTVYILLMMMPFQVLMLSDHMLLDGLHMLDTHGGLILLSIFSTFPVFIMYRFFENVPDALVEAAMLDGASQWQIFLHIGLPLGSPGVIAALVLGFLEYWNLLEPPMTFLKSKNLWPLSLYLPNIGLERAKVAFAASVIALIPAILVFLAGQDHLERGIAAAVKE